MKKAFNSGGKCVGNSTISQQLVKLILVSQHRSVKRKFIELIGAIKLELQLTSDEILELYLNRAYFGNGNYGVGLASRYYFGKLPRDLNLDECALLAGIIQVPRYDPIDRPVENKARANLILDLMYEHNFLKYPAVVPENYVIQKGHKRVVEAYAMHQWFWMKNEIVNLLHGKPHGEYKVWTTQDPEIQIYAQTRLRKTVAKNEGVEQGAVVVMLPTGDVLAMVGGAGNNIRARGTNRAIRNSGLFCPPAASTMKLVTYLTAIEHGFTQTSEIDASPFTLDDYSVRNYKGEEFDTVRMGFAFSRSINTAAVRLLNEIGFVHWRSVARRLGVPMATDSNDELGIAIGQNEMCLLDITGAYATVANDGYLSLPRGVYGIVGTSGNVIWNKPLLPSFLREFHQSHIKIMDHMLREVVVSGTAALAETDILFLMPRGKTGTADGSTSASFVGYTHTASDSDLVVGVWLGNDDPVTVPELQGGKAPASVFNLLLTDIAKHTKYFSMVR